MQGLDVKCSGTVKMLIDLELLAHTDYLVASDHSRWSQVLQYMRYVLYGVLSNPEPPVSCPQERQMCPVRELVMPARCQACISLVTVTFLSMPERPQSGMLCNTYTEKKTD